MTHPSHKQITVPEMTALQRERFGDDHMKWAFICPVCKDIATLQDFADAGANYERAGQECIGRHLGALSKDTPKEKYTGRGCDWTAYGLFRGPVEYTNEPLKSVWGFEVAPAPEASNG